MSLDNSITDALVDPDDVLGGGFEAEITTEETKEHIAAAHLTVEEQLQGQGLSDDRLARIELWLARHFIRVEPARQVDTETAGPMNRSYSGDFDRTFLERTSAGQTAMRLDTSDTLGTEDTIGFFST